MAATLSWKWKEEPISPVGFPDLDSEIDNTWGLFEDEEVQIQKSQSTPTHKQEKQAEPTRAEIATKLLQDLDEWIKEEPFSDWLEEKIDLPIFDDLPTGLDQRNYGPVVENIKSLPMPPLVMAVPSVISPSLEIKSPHNQFQDTQSLLREFENVFGKVEMAHGTLTPPQSPPVPTYNNIIPENPKEELITLHQMVPMQPIIQSAIPVMKITPLAPILPVVYTTERKEALLPLEQMVPETPSPDVVRELQAVEELVRTRAEDLVDISNSPSPSWMVYNNGSSDGVSPGRESEGDTYHVAPPSPCTSSSASSYGSGEEMCDDPEWIPASVQVPAPGCQKVGRKRGGGKPYSRPGIEEKRMRKKEQNKNAATRYRQKKKAEIEEILSEEKGLEDTNAELKLKVSDLSREIKYLKGLMRDLFKAKGLLK